MNIHHSTALSTPGAAAPWLAGGDFLSFRLGAAEYGIDILRVREIRSYEAPTRVAHLPEAIKGVVNLRGAIVPIVDLRVAMCCERHDYDALTAVIMLNLRDRVVGAVVDSVCDVLELRPESIQSPAQFGPAPGSAAGGPFVCAIGQFSDRCLLLLDIDALIAHADSAIATPQG